MGGGDRASSLRNRSLVFRRFRLKLGVAFSWTLWICVNFRVLFKDWNAWFVRVLSLKKLVSLCKKCKSWILPVFHRELDMQNLILKILIYAGRNGANMTYQAGTRNPRSSCSFSIYFIMSVCATCSYFRIRKWMIVCKFFGSHTYHNTIGGSLSRVCGGKVGFC